MHIGLLIGNAAQGSVHLEQHVQLFCRQNRRSGSVCSCIAVRRLLHFFLVCYYSGMVIASLRGSAAALYLDFTSRESHDAAAILFVLDGGIDVANLYVFICTLPRLYQQ